MLTRRAVLGGSALLLLRPRLARADITSNLAGRWLMNENSGTTIGDTSGNAIHVAFAAAAAAPTWTAGKYGAAAVHFTRASSQRASVAIPTTSPLNPGAGNFTVAAWVQRATSGVEHGICGTWPNPGTTAGWHVKFATSNTLNAGLATNTNSVSGSSSGAVTDTLWHHVALVFNRASSATWYLDGAASGSFVVTSLTGNITPAASEVFAIGGIGDHVGIQHMDGAIDELYLFQRALSAGDILELMNASGVEGRRRVVVY